MRHQDTWHNLTETCHGAEAHFLRQCANLEVVQKEYLCSLLAENAETIFGRAHGFASIANYAEYAASVPISNYEVYVPYIEAALGGAPSQLTAATPLFVETTGGSTSGAKTIPYTQGALDGYWNAMRPWFANMIRRQSLREGRIYFALSPVGRKKGQRMGVLPLGSPWLFAYFGSAAADLAKLSIAPAELSALSDFNAWCFATCVHLLSARDLALIWVWSPTYLTELVRAIQRLKPALIEAIASGVPTPHEAALSGVPFPPGDPARAAELDVLVGNASIDTRAIWPQLDVISCWMDASSAPFAAELKQLFPEVWFQAKGLMLIEGAVTVPFGDGQGSPLAVESVLFEFVDSGGVRPAWNLEHGGTYRVLISNKSGLYRYDTGDVVEVVGFTNETPRLVFKGRAGSASDLCGEKLTEEFVLSCVEAASDGPAIFAILAPSSQPHPHYALCVDGELGKRHLATFVEKLEKQLRRNPQYAYARDIGQLSPLEIHVTDNLFARYQKWAASKGRSVAGLKAPALILELPSELLSNFTREE